MKICTITEWDNFKDTEKIKAYYEFVKKNTPFLEKLDKELGSLRSSWADGTGHVVSIVEYPSVEAYAKVLNNEEYQKLMVNLARRIQNVSIRVLRPSAFITIE
jgi:hypothetical protein